MRIGRILFFAIFLVSSTVLVATITILNSVNYSLPSNDLTAFEVSKKQLELRKEYQAKLLKLLENYSAIGKMENFTDGAASLESELLKLSAPSQYKDLHFQLVSAIDQIKDGTDKNKRALRSSLEAIIQDYSWLASTLSLFIINNFF